MSESLLPRNNFAVCFPIARMLISPLFESLQDPFETEERGWTNSGYYTTGSTADWTSIQFGEQTSVETKVESTSSSTTTIASISTSNSAASFMSSSVPSFGCMCMFVVCAHRMIFDAY